jgi:TolB-like protein/Flp pilus assembly protein TadD
MRSDDVEFGPFCVHFLRREVTRDGTPVQLGGRALDILLVLAAAKDQLIAKVWSGAVVDENNIQVHVSALRKALDDGGGAHQYVRTVQGRGYRLVGAGDRTPQSDSVQHVLPVPDKPSIAVLPFANLSNDPEQEYFADGVVEEITLGLSRMRWLLVIARNSSFTFKGRAVDVKQVGRDLGVRYVLEGSVRKAANRLRIAAQLIDAGNGAHLWADRFEGDLEDIFDLQDRVAGNVVSAIAPKLEQSEIARAKSKPTENLDAYDYLLRGKASLYSWTALGIDEALRLFYRAIELDREFGLAYGMAAWCHTRRMAFGWMTHATGEVAETARVARLAVDLASDDAVALCAAGFALARVVGDLDDGVVFIDRALELNPNLATAWLTSGWVRAFLGQPDAAIEHLMHAMRLSPLDPLMFGMHNGMAFAHLLAGRYDESASWAERALRVQPNWVPAWRNAAASHALAGRLDNARQAMARMRLLAPETRLSNLDGLMPLRRPEDLARFAEGLRKAGLPE